MNKYFFSLLLVFALTGCAGMSDYVKNVISDPRNEKLVYRFFQKNDFFKGNEHELLIYENKLNRLKNLVVNMKS